MAIYIPVLEYPRNALQLSEEERSSFDVDNRDQVADFVTEAIERICRNAPTSLNLVKLGRVIESMLDDGQLDDDLRKEQFGVDPNSDDHRYRDFVMDYVENNYSSAIAKCDAMSDALKKSGMTQC